MFDAGRMESGLRGLQPASRRARHAAQRKHSPEGDLFSNKSTRDFVRETHICRCRAWLMTARYKRDGEDENRASPGSQLSFTHPWASRFCRGDSTPGAHFSCRGTITGDSKAEVFGRGEKADSSLTTPKLKKALGAPCTQNDSRIREQNRRTSPTKYESASQSPATRTLENFRKAGAEKLRKTTADVSTPLRFAQHDSEWSGERPPMWTLRSKICRISTGVEPRGPFGTSSLPG